MVERAVQTVKTGLRKILIENKSKLQLEAAITKFLEKHRNLPTTENGIIPAHRVFNYKPRTELSSLKYKNKLSEKNNCLSEIEENAKIDKRNKFELNENIWYISKTNGHAFSYKEKIVKKHSSLTYWVKIGDTIKLAHVNQMRKYMIKRFSENNVVIRKYEEQKVETDEKQKTSTPIRKSQRKIQLTRRYQAT